MKRCGAGNRREEDKADMTHEILRVSDADAVFAEIEQKVRRLRQESASRRWVGNAELAYKAGSAQHAGMVAEEAIFRFKAALIAMLAEADH